MELAAARAAQESVLNGSPIENTKVPQTNVKRKYLMVIGINTAFSSRKRRDSVRATWMPQGLFYIFSLIITSFDVIFVLLIFSFEQVL